MWFINKALAIGFAESHTQECVNYLSVDIILTGLFLCVIILILIIKFYTKLKDVNYFIKSIIIIIFFIFLNFSFQITDSTSCGASFLENDNIHYENIYNFKLFPESNS
jgi:hypothetical protein